ncbi:MAG TPA: phospholipase D-like domain-containing protein [Anaerolineae bacterium]|nr:phospholipase D-like domain-containing protein [Anaerolineae bacterium]HQK12432.1 phospholipase D-like domain-containing protein [Anaerolineae bacterium]
MPPAHTPVGGKKARFGWKELLISLFLVIVAWAGIDLLGSCGASKPIETTEDANIQVFFTTPRSPDKAAYHQGGLDEKLVAAIDGAQKSIDVAVFEIDLANVTEALIRAHKRGVKVRVVTDSDYAGELGPERLLAAQIHVVFDDSQPFMHDKFVIIDGKQVWTGSWNLTDNDTYRNNNNVVVVNSKLLAENYTTEFEEMYVDGKFGPFSPDNTPYPLLSIAGVQVENFFEPEGNARARIIKLIEEAQSSIDVMAFVFTDDQIARAIVARHRAGVKVRMVIETRNLDADGSDVVAFQKAGVDILLDGNPYMLHHKVIVIDNAVVITGSYNFSSSAAEQNDENVLILHSAEIAGEYTAEFERVYAQAKAAQ